MSQADDGTDIDIHRVYGIYTNMNEANEVYERLIQNGFTPSQMEVLDRQPLTVSTAPDSDEVRNEMLMDGVIGTAIGAGVGVLGEAVIAATNISLFIASPILATLVMVGWGASVGGLIGVAAGAGTPETKHVSDLIHDAIKQGRVVLIVHAKSEAQTTTAQFEIGNSMKKFE